MSFSLSRFLLLLSIAGLFLVWVISAAFYSSDRLRLFIVASGIIFFVILTTLIISFSSLMRSLNQMSDSARLALPVLTHISPAKRNDNEIEFVSETFGAVVEQLQAKQQELNLLHARLGERAASAEAFSQYIISSLPSGLIAFDLQGLIRVINQPAREIFELPIDSTPTEISYLHLFESHPAFLQIIFDSLNNNKFISRCEVDYRTQSNLIRRLGLTVAPLEVNSKVAGVLCLVSDITEINRLKEQLALQQNLESLGLMSAGLAHEFKNSLAALHIYSQFLNRLRLEEKGHEAVDGLTRELRVLSEMVTAFLDFSRPQSLVLAPVSLEVLLKDCAHELHPLAHEKKVKFGFCGSFVTCHGDSILLHQVINNLFHNALEAAASNPLRERLITVRGSVDSDKLDEVWAKIEIEDTGSGIKIGDLPFVFIPFFTTKRQGHGIGLAVSHRIITQHGGTLTAANSERGGAVFTLRLKAPVNS